METIVVDVEKYITFGPGRFKDEKWDLAIIVLNYKGQILDISGAYTTKIYDEKKKKWKRYSSKFETAQIKNVYGMKVPVMDPGDLIAYKKLLNGEHQKADINAVENYIRQRRLIG